VIRRYTLNTKISTLLSFPVMDQMSDIGYSWGHVNPIGPRACYDEGKRVAETLTYGFQRQDHVDVRVARIFNTYGTLPCPGVLCDASDIYFSPGPRSSCLGHRL
jgi:nucleoside-diphosphate-sugar epimerase